jgi:hypothetical protein
MSPRHPVGAYVKVREQDIWGTVVEEWGGRVVIEDAHSDYEAPENRLEYRVSEVEAA